MITTIHLDNVRFYAYHGVMPQEKTVGNNFSVTVRLEANLTRATEDDSLDHTISYADVYQVVASEMAIPSELIEHAAGRIYRSIRSAFPLVTRLEVRLYKYNPPGCGETKRAGIVLSDYER